MDSLHPAIIDRLHAHVYFDAASRDAAWALRETIDMALAGQMVSRRAWSWAR